VCSQKAEDKLCRKQFEKRRQVAIEKIMESAEKICSKKLKNWLQMNGKR